MKIYCNFVYQFISRSVKLLTHQHVLERKQGYKLKPAVDMSLLPTAGKDGDTVAAEITVTPNRSIGVAGKTEIYSYL